MPNVSLASERLLELMFRFDRLLLQNKHIKVYLHLSIY
jgi:hypothetical protein